MKNIAALAEALAQNPQTAQTAERVICGAQTRKGVCQYPTLGRTCPTHSLTPEQIKQRNKKVAAKFAFNDYGAYSAQRRAAGQRGFAATAAKHGAGVANNIAREWRLKHPSVLETWAMHILDDAGITYEREYQIDDDNRTVDFRIGNGMLEITKHGKRTDDKLQLLESRGFATLCVTLSEWDAINDLLPAQSARQAILQFAEANRTTQLADDDELPF